MKFCFLAVIALALLSFVMPARADGDGGDEPPPPDTIPVQLTIYGGETDGVYDTIGYVTYYAGSGSVFDNCSVFISVPCMISAGTPIQTLLYFPDACRVLEGTANIPMDEGCLPYILIQGGSYNPDPAVNPGPVFLPDPPSPGFPLSDNPVTPYGKPEPVPRPLPKPPDDPMLPPAPSPIPPGGPALACAMNYPYGPTSVPTPGLTLAGESIASQLDGAVLGCEGYACYYDDETETTYTEYFYKYVAAPDGTLKYAFYDDNTYANPIWVCLMGYTP